MNIITNHGMIVDVLADRDQRIAELEAKLARQEQSQLAMEEHARAMIDRLEAKLAKVREWQCSEAIEASAFDRLYAILDDKEP